MYRRSQFKIVFYIFVIITIFICSLFYFIIYEQYSHNILNIKNCLDSTGYQRMGSGSKDLLPEHEHCVGGHCKLSQKLFSCMSKEKWELLSLLSFTNITLIPLDQEFAYCVLNMRRSSKHLNSIVTTFGILPNMTTGNYSKKVKLQIRFKNIYCVSVLSKPNCKIIKCEEKYYFRFITLEDKDDYWKGVVCHKDTVPGAHLSAFAIKKLHLKPVYVSTVPVQYPLDFYLFHKHLTCSKLVECNRSMLKRLKRKYPSYFNTTPVLTEENFEWLLNLRDSLHGYRMTPMLTGGTLLGWYRDCGLIPYTTDFDLVIQYEEFNQHFEAIFLNHKDLRLVYRFNKLTDSLEYVVFDPTNTKTDIFFLYKEANYSWYGGIGKRRTKVKFTYPPLKNICATDLLGYLFHVPCNYLDYIVPEYGSMWHKPAHDDDFIYFNDSKSISIVKKLTRDEYFADYFKEFE